MKPIFLFSLRYFFFPLTKIFVEKIEGEENIPKTNNFIIAPNHLNGRDHFFIGYTFKKNIRDIGFVGAMDKLKTFFQSGLLYYLGETIVINRKKESREKIIEKIQKEIKNNKIIVIYPEGDSNHKNRLLKGRTGIAELITKNIGVLPVGLRNGKRGRIISIGKLINFSQEIEELEKTKKESQYLILRKITDKIMNRISSLSKKPYLYEKN